MNEDEILAELKAIRSTWPTPVTLETLKGFATIGTRPYQTCYQVVAWGASGILTVLIDNVNSKVVAEAWVRAIAEAIVLDECELLTLPALDGLLNRINGVNR